MNNIFDNPKAYIDQINNNIRINKKLKFDGKSFICVFFTRDVRRVANFVFLNLTIENYTILRNLMK